MSDQFFGKPKTDIQKEGYQAYKDGKQLDENPHTPDTWECSDWMRGWFMCKHETHPVHCPCCGEKFVYDVPCACQTGECPKCRRWA